MRKTLLSSLATVGLSAASLLVAGSANALTFTLFTDRTAWEAALSGTPSTETFNSFTSDVLFGGSSISAGSLTLSSNADVSGEASIDVPPFNNGATGIDGTPMVNATGLETNENIVIQLPGAFSAFGFDYQNYDIGNDALTVFVGTDIVTSLPAASGANGFIGFTASGTFSAVEFLSSSSNGTFNALDNVSWGAAAPTSTTPEPGALFGLVSLGALAVGSRMNRKQG